MIHHPPRLTHSLSLPSPTKPAPIPPIPVAPPTSPSTAVVQSPRRRLRRRVRPQPSSAAAQDRRCCCWLLRRFRRSDATAQSRRLLRRTQHLPPPFKTLNIATHLLPLGDLRRLRSAWPLHRRCPTLRIAAPSPMFSYSRRSVFNLFIPLRIAQELSFLFLGSSSSDRSLPPPPAAPTTRCPSLSDPTSDSRISPSYSASNFFHS